MIDSTFAVTASGLLAAGDAAGAAALCTQGLLRFPEYATGYLVLARALCELQDTIGAVNAARRGLACAPQSEVLHALSDASRNVGAESATDDIVATPEVLELGRLARELEGARIPRVAEATGPAASENPAFTLPVSPTLARIYEQQGLLAEAIAAYRTLADLDDPKSEEYKSRIRELERRITR